MGCKPLIWVDSTDHDQSVDIHLTKWKLCMIPSQQLVTEILKQEDQLLRKKFWQQ